MLPRGFSKFFFILILAVVTLAFLTILRPYASAVLWAAILAVIFYKTKEWIRRRATGNRNGLASLLTLLLICLIVFTPLAVILSSLVNEFNVVYRNLQEDNTSMSVVFADVIRHLPSWGQQLLADYDLDDVGEIQRKLSAAVMQGSQFLAGSALAISKNTFSLAVGFGVMLYLLFFLLKDGSHLVALIMRAIPLENRVKYRLIARFAAVARATVKGTVVVAVIQGFLGGVAFWFLGIQGSLLWGALMAFFSLVPAVGTALVWVPAAIYLFAVGALWKAIALVVWFVVVVGLVDNILRPILVGKDIKMPDYLILIATLGGLTVYGINGFVTGPLIAALFVTCWQYLAEPDREDKVGH
ncbi:AI-2E family transporter [Franconibacter helveticus 513]|uniref:AI-2E family transporter n=1 Tax=Franconibacter helveticus TaxID=357240 RepID=UPI000425D8B3|nr:AI-2E family transporter [Franconibacter helveticus]MDU6923226.1 AI-2E family transporter [Franconibacter helveticus]